MLRRVEALGVLIAAVAAIAVQSPVANAQTAGPAAWQSDLKPIAPADWNYDFAAHLLERAGFGGTPAEIQALAAMSPQDAVRHLVRYQEVQDVDLPPFVETGIYPSRKFNRGSDGATSKNVPTFAIIVHNQIDQMPPARRAYFMDPAQTGVTPEMQRIAKTEKQAVVDAFYYYQFVDGLEMARAQTWLADRMLKTQRPLQEKLVLFWHGHFATGNDKVHDYRKMLDQFAMLRENANGNLRNLLIGIGKDPAMLVYLDNQKNVKGHPNENFAREIMELFSLGVGNYTETDIKEAARSFTGWSLDNNYNQFMNRENLHDEGEKTFLGKTGSFKGEDIVDIILQQPACSHFIARKLYRFFGREDFSKDFEDKIADSLRQNKYEISPFLEQVFLSKDFYSPASYGTQIKSPVQLVVSTYKKLGISSAPTSPEFAGLTGGLGQQIFTPPNVKGWDGGKAWINPATMFQRENVVRYIAFPEEMPVNPTAYLEGTKNLSGAVIHEQFLKLWAKGNLTDFPDNGTGKMANNMDAGDPMMKSGSAASETSKLNAEDYNLFRGVFNGVIYAKRMVPAEPRKVPDFKLVAILKTAGVTDASGVVDALTRRFLRVAITGDRRAELIAFCTRQMGGEKVDYSHYTTEKNLREVLHLILSLPEYQLS